jgi:multicomponent Na+:H+ antiporter subunit C
VSVYAYLVAGWLLLVGCIGIARSRNLVHAIVCLSVCQSGTYVLLLAVGYQSKGTAPVFATGVPTRAAKVVDPVVQAMALTDVVVSATVTALLLALAVQIAKQHRTVDPDQLSSLQG